MPFVKSNRKPSSSTSIWKKIFYSLFCLKKNKNKIQDIFYIYLYGHILVLRNSRDIGETPPQIRGAPIHLRRND